MIEMIETRRNSEKVERHDLLSNLIGAGVDDGEIEPSNADDLIGKFSSFLSNVALFS